MTGVARPPRPGAQRATSAGAPVRRAQGLAIPVGAVMVGLGAIGFLILSARSLGPERYAPLAALWALIFTLAPGLFQPLEHEVTRDVAARRARGAGVSPLLRTATATGAGLVLLVLLLSLPAFTYLVEDVFDGEALLVAALLLSLVGYAGSHLVRGVLVGCGRPTPYGAMLTLEGLARVGPAALLFAVGVSSVGAFGLVAGAAPLLAVLLVLPWARGVGGHGPPAAVGRFMGSIGLLLVSSLLSQALINLGPIVVKVLATAAEAQAAGALLAGLTLARVPVLAVAPVQAVLLPRLSAAYAVGDLATIRRILRGATLAVTALAGVAAVAALVGGPAVLSLLFGPEFQLRRLDLVLLAVGACAYCAALLVSLALIASERRLALALCWSTGLAVAAAVVALLEDLLLRVEIGLLAGAATTAALMLVVVGRGLRSGGALSLQGPRSAPAQDAVRRDDA